MRRARGSGVLLCYQFVTLYLYTFEASLDFWTRKHTCINANEAKVACSLIFK
jgi:hypothetical protein